MHTTFIAHTRTFVASIALVVAAFIVPSMDTAHAQVPPPTCTLYASPSTVSYNGSTTLQWYTTDATSRTITDIGFVMTSGIQPIYNITSSKTYVMTVSGPGGTNTCQTTVNVSGQSSQTPSCNIVTSSANIGYGGYGTVSWNTSNAQNASLTDYGSVALSGSQSVGPIYGSRTYTLNVSGNGGSNSCQVTVYSNNTTNNNAPTCSLDVSQTSVTSGQPVSLYWSTANAYSVSVNTIGSVNTNGSQSVYPYTTTTYVLTAQGNGGTTTCTRTVYVDSNYTNYYNAPSCSLSTTTPVVNYGGTATLTWNTSNTNSVTIDNGVGVVQANGSYIVGNITSPRTYTLTAVGNGGTRTCQTTVTVQGTTGYIPPINNGGSSASCGITVQPDGVGGYTLAWYTQNAILASISGIGNVGKTGTYAITPMQNTVYTMTVRGYDGLERTCQATAYAAGTSGSGTGGGYGGVYYGNGYGYGTGYGYYGYGNGGTSGGGVPLTGVPYTGAEDYVYPLFIAAFMITAFYATTRVQKRIAF